MPDRRVRSPSFEDVLLDISDKLIYTEEQLSRAEGRILELEDLVRDLTERVAQIESPDQPSFPGEL